MGKDVSEILILLVEDEPIIAEAARLALEDGGYSVTYRHSGEEAIAALDELSATLSCVVTDVRLAEGPDGWEVARHARELRPDLPIVYMTGDSAADWPIQGVPKSTLLQKPFAAAQVVTAVSTLLNQADGSTS